MTLFLSKVYKDEIRIKVFDEKEDDSFDIPFRSKRDLNQIQWTCAKYLGTKIPWKPLNSLKKEDAWNYFRDEEHKIGWCFNPKV